MRFPMNIAIGDGSTTSYKLPNNADIWNPLSGTPILYLNNWDGQNQLYSTARINKLKYSEDITQSVWITGASTASAGSIVAPDGSATGDILVETTANTNHLIYQGATVTAGAVTISIYVKPNGRTWCILSDGLSYTTKCVWFNLADDGYVGTVQSSVTGYGIRKTSNGWYRIWCTATQSAGTAYLQLNLATADNTRTYVGDATKGLYLWGAQMEQGTTPTKYIKKENTSFNVIDYTLAAQSYDIALATAPNLGDLLSWDGSTLDRF